MWGHMVRHSLNCLPCKNVRQWLQKIAPPNDCLNLEMNCPH